MTGSASRAFACLVALLAAGCAALPGALAPGAAFRDCPDCPEMAPVPAGRFLMGTTGQDADRWDDRRESPAHEVIIRRPFAMAKHEVTRGQFARFAADTSYSASGCTVWTGQAWVHHTSLNWMDPGFPQTDEHPVVCVAWQDAKAFTAWLSSRTDASYRLPTEAEWEYAARAGTTSVRFWGDDVALGCLYANIGDQSLNRAHLMEGLAPCEDGYTYTAPVGSYRPNAFGLHDMLGNAWEWTEDCWHLGYDGAPLEGAARLQGDCSNRVPRGASWNSHYRNVRSANRGTYQAAGRYYHIGFRVVRDLDAGPDPGR